VQSSINVIRLFSRLLAMPALLALALLAVPSADPAHVTHAAGRRVQASTRLNQYEVTGAASREQRSAIAATGVDILAAGPESVTILATAEQAQLVAALGFRIAVAPRLADFPAPDAAYHSYAELETEIRAVAARHPRIVRLFSLGRSYEGRELWAAKVSDNPDLDESEPEALFVGQYHAREHLTVEMMLYLLHTLADGYGAAGQEQVTHLVDTREIFLIFSLNPDGGEYDIAADAYRFWRKNRQPNADGSFGTDLNRNHSYMWACCGGSSFDPTDETFHGSGPASTPEVRALEAFVNGRAASRQQQITVAISFHTYGEFILWPYGYTYTAGPPAMPAADQAVFEAIGGAMAATNGYTPMQSSSLYISNGDFADWAYGVHGIFAFTFELYPNYRNFGGFYPPGALIARETSRNHDAVLYLLEQAACPYAAVETAAAHCRDRWLTTPQRVWMPIIGRG
jgi:carboxypeptidase T